MCFCSLSVLLLLLLLQAAVAAVPPALAEETAPPAPPVFVLMKETICGKYVLCNPSLAANFSLTTSGFSPRLHVNRS